ncbi:multidrug efflux SMR transporter [Cytobacillus spongiae]|jgi:quaternary ammonium compound-resistance protein SugE|uniref:DMT family transporter n=1 Tax=Cytobacillus spongiae TaxID=2901381 RepID=UPI001F4783BB|nr:multidrug efflux SMR transporter [Cytobacillus spongiae]UII56194.1 multidrug efflux SMR transporter [Cytobacillus spongiae]
MPWIYLVLAGICEIGWAFGLKYSKGFTELVPSVVTGILIIVSFILFSKAMKSIPIGTAYAVFTGIGAAGTVIIGMLFLDEGGGIGKLLFLGLLLGGIIGLKMTTGDEDNEKEKEN